MQDNLWKSQRREGSWIWLHLIQEGSSGLQFFTGPELEDLRGQAGVGEEEMMQLAV